MLWWFSWGCEQVVLIISQLDFQFCQEDLSLRAFLKKVCLIGKNKWIWKLWYWSWCRGNGRVWMTKVGWSKFVTGKALYVVLCSTIGHSKNKHELRYLGEDGSWCFVWAGRQGCSSSILFIADETLKHYHNEQRFITQWKWDEGKKGFGDRAEKRAEAFPSVG